MKTCNIVTGSMYKSYYPLQQTKKTKDGYHGEILSSLEGALSSMTNRRWNFVFGLTLTFPAGYPPQINNMRLMEFLKWFAERLGYKIPYRYVWVREQDLGPHPHYHIVFVVDGDRTSSGWGWLVIAQNIWAAILEIPSADGLVEVSNPEPFPLAYAPECKRPVSHGMMIDNWAASNEERRKEVFNWICYLGKIKTKHGGTGCHSFGTSRF